MSQKKNKNRNKRRNPAPGRTAAPQSEPPKGPTPPRTQARPLWVVWVGVLLIAIGLVRMAQDGAPPVSPAPPTPPPVTPVAPSPPHYVGGAVCAGCHQSEHDAWH